MSLDHLVLSWIHDFNQVLVVHLNGSQDLGLVFMLVIHLLMPALLPWYSICGWVIVQTLKVTFVGEKNELK
jgi:hypothetical protein